MNLVLFLGIGSFLIALSMVAFAFYYLGKNKTINANYYQFTDLFILTFITTVADPASNYLQTLGVITFGYLATATISYILGYTDRPVTSIK